jgi:hypothetical protein
METVSPCYWRSLFIEMEEFPGAVVPSDLAVDWVAEHPECVEMLHAMGQPAARDLRLPIGWRGPNEFADLLWELYAFQRVLEILIAPFQQPPSRPGLNNWITDRPWYTGPVPEPDAYHQFCQALRMWRIPDQPFHPFYHEIVEVEQAADATEPFSVVAQLWPGFMVGDLLAQRAGVAVRVGTDHAVKDHAEAGPLFWAWWRRNRVAADLSHGWGHNSQWRTLGRRDYVNGRVLLYNVDGSHSPDRSWPEEPDDDRPRISAGERLEVLRHRCLLKRDVGRDLWPYDDTFAEHVV